VSGSLRRFTLLELGLWASLYPIYLAVRGSTIGDATTAAANAESLIGVERRLSLFHEPSLQSALSFASEFFSAYYMVGFGPLLAAVLLWLGLRDRARYRELRTLLFASLALAVVLYIAFPTAPPRLVPGLGIADTVGLSSHDTGSFAGIRFNPYAAMPSMHVGWSLLVGVIGFRAARRPLLRAFFALHPALMAVTVSATGNHYFVDSAAGALIALLTLWLLTSMRRLTPVRLLLRPA
jgi:membrane-associated phospholipid phosphatase